MRDIKPETLAVRGGLAADGEMHPIVPSITPGTTFLRDRNYNLEEGQASYIRGVNAGDLEAEQLLAELEGGFAAALFASGTAAAAAIVHTLRPGDRIVAPRIMYWGLRNWMVDFCQQWGLILDFYEAAERSSLESVIAAAPTQIVWLETPSNPTWEVADIALAAAFAKNAGASLVVDSTVATPVLTCPLKLGADIVFHSATKYLNGHSDVIAGAVVTAEDNQLWQKILYNRTNSGAVLGTFEAWLLLRGMRTLYLRVQQASRHAQAIAERLQQHPQILEVQYPGLPTNPGYQIACRQMQDGFGGMLSIRVKGGREAALAVAGHCEVFLRATSLGGVESLIEHRHSIEGSSSIIPVDLLRLSIGLEALEDLISDLEQALDAL